MYTPSRNYLNSHIAGFDYWDGVDVIKDLKIGTSLSLIVEDDNPYDPNAVAIFFGETKIGYIPRMHNADLSLLLYFGHTDVFETKISCVYPEGHSEERYSISIRVRDKRWEEEL